MNAAQSAMLATACSDPAYHAALAEAGYSSNDTFQYAGRNYTHDDVAEAFSDSYWRHRGEYLEYAPPVLRQRRADRHRKRQFLAAVKKDVGGMFGLSWWTIAFGIALTVLAGPAGLIISICTVLFEIFFSKDIIGDPQLMAAAL